MHFFTFTNKNSKIDETITKNSNNINIKNPKIVNNIISDEEKKNNEMNKKLEEMEDAPMLSFEGKKIKAKVVSVYDGDTIKVIFPLKDTFYKWNCRLTGIDTPELRTRNINEKNYGYEVRDILREKILNKIVYLECGDFDKYGRLLTEVFLNDNNISVNEWLIENKYAFAYDGGTKQCWEEYLINQIKCKQESITCENDEVNNETPINKEIMETNDDAHSTTNNNSATQEHIDEEEITDDSTEHMFISDFLKNRIEKEQGGKIKKNEIQEECKKYIMNVYGKKLKNTQNLYDAMNKTFGEYKTKNRCWSNVKIIDVDNEEVIEEMI